MFGTCHNLRAATAFGIRFAHFCAHHFYAADFAVAIHFYTQRLDVEFELYAFFPRVFHFAAGTRHVLFITTIGTGNVLCPLAYRRAHAVHRSVATAKDHHAFAFHADERFVAGFTKAH